MSNIHWGGEIHHDHVFDIYAIFSTTKDPVQIKTGHATIRDE